MNDGWSSLEILKLAIAALTPILVAILGWYLTRVAKNFEYAQWRNQRLIDKRVHIYDDLAPQLNDMLCYFTFVGNWKEFTPHAVVELKRAVDKKIYLATPFFAPDFTEACSKFLGLCYTTFQNWGQDATLKTPLARRKEAAGASWKSEWDSCFSTESSSMEEIREAYQDIMSIFSREIGLNPAGRPMLGRYPKDALKR